MSTEEISLRVKIRLECHRRDFILRLRKKFKLLVQQILNSPASNESFNIWLLESLALSAANQGSNILDDQKLHKSSYDYLIPSVFPSESDRICRSLLNSFPCAHRHPSNSNEGRRYASQYLEACLAVLPDDKKSTYRELAEALEASEDSGAKCYFETREAATPFLLDALGPCVTKLCGAMQTEAATVHAEFLDVRRSLVTGHSLPTAAEGGEQEKEQEGASATLVRCDAEENGEFVKLTLGRGVLEPSDPSQHLLSYKIRDEHYQKLKSRARDVARTQTQPQPQQQQQQHQEGDYSSDPSPADVDARIWIVLHRYNSLAGPEGNGGGWQMAAPKEVYRFLQERFQIQLECFASPLNCTLSKFCSAFADTDRPFGSQGNFFHLQFEDHMDIAGMEGGSFQLNPPYDEEILDRMAQKVLATAARVDDRAPLQFIFVLPHWPDCRGIQALLNSELKQAELVLEKEEHRYINGFQHFVRQKHRMVLFECGSLMLWLQNARAARRWPVSQEMLDELRETWR